MTKEPKIIELVRKRAEEHTLDGQIHRAALRVLESPPWPKRSRPKKRPR
jgi:hypothetical protein